MYVRALFVVLVTFVSACAGSAASVIRPKDTTAAAALGAEDCHPLDAYGEPLAIDLQAHERGAVEAMMRRGQMPVLQYTCEKIRILHGCHVNADFAFVGVNPKPQRIFLDDADQVTANIASLGGNLLGAIKASAKRGARFELMMTLVGSRDAAKPSVSGDELVEDEGNDGACTTATHVVLGTFVGAFSLASKTGANLAASGKVLFSDTAAESNSTRESSFGDGRVEACQAVSPHSTEPPDACDGILRLKIARVVPKAAAQPAPVARAPKPAPRPPPEKTVARVKETCAPGLTASEGKCVAGTTNAAHRCKPGDAADCEAQCERGDMASCVDAATLKLSSDAALAGRLLRKACDGGIGEACFNLGTLLGGLANAQAAATPTQGENALALYEKGCDLAHGASCAVAAEAATDWPGHRVRLLERGCKLGDHDACMAMADAFRRGDTIAKDLPRAAAAYKRACDAEDAVGCLRYARMLRAGLGVAKDPVKALAIFGRICDGNAGVGCPDMMDMMLAGDGVPKETARGLEYLEQDCRSVPDAASCEVLGSFYEFGLNVRRSLDRARALYTKACVDQPDLSVATGCTGLAAMLLTGQGGARDERKARKLLGDTCSIEARACAVKSVLDGAKKEVAVEVPIEETAEDSLEAAATFCGNGYVRECTYEGAMLLNVGGVENTRRGRKLLKDACAAGDALACLLDGRLK